MMIGAQQLQIIFRMIQRISIRVIHFYRNPTCLWMPFIPSANFTLFALRFNQPTTNIIRNACPTAALFFPYSPSFNVIQITLLDMAFMGTKFRSPIFQNLTTSLTCVILFPASIKEFSRTMAITNFICRFIGRYIFPAILTLLLSRTHF